jgi:hypothetical protein
VPHGWLRNAPRNYKLNVPLMLKELLELVLLLLRLEEVISLLILNVPKTYLLIRNTVGLAFALKLKRKDGTSLVADLSIPII